MTAPKAPLPNSNEKHPTVVSDRLPPISNALLGFVKLLQFHEYTLREHKEYPALIRSGPHRTMRRNHFTYGVDLAAQTWPKPVPHRAQLGWGLDFKKWKKKYILIMYLIWNWKSALQFGFEKLYGDFCLLLSKWWKFFKINLLRF